MIEVNLLPGGKKRASKRSRLLPQMPDFGGVGLPADRWVLGASVVVIAIVAVTAYLYLGVNSRYEETEVAIEDAARDSARYADLIEQAENLRAQRDSIADRVAIIQEIDRGRYIWPHILDEVSRALPEFTWLTDLTQVSLGEELQIRLSGMAGNNFALTSFMQNLEASPFIRRVTLISTELSVQSQEGVSRTVSQFTLEAAYQEPPSDLMDMVPLFEGDTPEISSQ